MSAGTIEAEVADALEYVRERFGESILDARKLSPVRLTLAIAKDLLELYDRDETVRAALRMARNALPNSTDEDDVKAVLEMAIPYADATGNAFWRVGGQVLVALERIECARGMEGGAA